MNYFKLYADCTVSDGYTNSLIIDLQRGKYQIVPKTLSLIIKELKFKSISELRNEIEKDSISYFDSYLEFLINEEYGFLTNSPNSFLTSKKLFFNQNGVELLIENYNTELNKFLFETNLKIVAIFLRIDRIINSIELSSILTKISEIKFLEYISVCIDYNDDFKIEILNELAKRFPKLGQFHIYSSPIIESIALKELTIEFYNYNYQGFKGCGTILPRHFMANTKLFNLSINHNSCLNMKISIDKDGNIRNCPAMPLSYGNIKDTTLEEALNKPGFKKYWNLTKDLIEVCKDCEFRYICTDCRAFTERTHTNKDGLDTSKPLKCGYDPYTGKWEEWSTNPLKQKAMKFYNFEL